MQLLTVEVSSCELSGEGEHTLCECLMIRVFLDLQAIKILNISCIVL